VTSHHTTCVVHILTIICCCFQYFSMFYSCEEEEEEEELNSHQSLSVGSIGSSDRFRFAGNDARIPSPTFSPLRSPSASVNNLLYGAGERNAWTRADRAENENHRRLIDMSVMLEDVKLRQANQAAILNQHTEILKAILETLTSAPRSEGQVVDINCG